MYQGRYDEAGRCLLAAPPRGVGAVPHLRAWGRHLLAAHRYEEALGMFLAAGDVARRQGGGSGHLSWRTDAAQALLGLGRAGRAADLLAEELALAGAVGPRYHGRALRVWSVFQPAADRSVTLARAVTELRAGGDRLELARALADLGHTVRVLGEEGLAGALLRRAWQLAADCGALNQVNGMPFKAEQLATALKEAIDG